MKNKLKHSKITVLIVLMIMILLSACSKQPETETQSETTTATIETASAPTQITTQSAEPKTEAKPDPTTATSTSTLAETTAAINSNVASNIYEYWAKDIYQTAELFGDMTETHSIYNDYPIVKFANNDVELEALESDNSICNITLKSNSNYSLDNIKIGMSMKEVTTKISPHGKVSVTDKRICVEMMECDLEILSDNAATVSKVILTSYVYHYDYVGTAIVHADGGLNMRTGFGKEYKVIGQIPDGSEVQVIRYDDEWAYIMYDMNQGCVAVKYLDITMIN